MHIMCREEREKHAAVLLALIHAYSESFVIPLKYQATDKNGYKHDLPSECNQAKL